MRGPAGAPSVAQQRRLTNALSVACPCCEVAVGEPCTNSRAQRIVGARGVQVAVLCAEREVRFAVEREIEHSIIMPKRGGIYWCPDDPVPPPVLFADDSGECRHVVDPEERCCACHCVRLPPVAYRVRLLAFAPARRRVQTVNGTETEELPSIVLRVDAPDAVRTYIPGSRPREDWSGWDCEAFDLARPETPGLWTWSGTLTIGWIDDDPDRYADDRGDEIDLRWEGAWTVAEWPDDWRFAEDAVP